jgi:hypothetical protein
LRSNLPTGRQATFYKYKAKFGGMEVSDARRLRTLEARIAKLKTLLAERILDSPEEDKSIQRSDLPRGHSSGCRGKKVVTPDAKREAAAQAGVRCPAGDCKAICREGGVRGLSCRSIKRALQAHPA